MNIQPWKLRCIAFGNVCVLAIFCTCSQTRTMDSPPGDWRRIEVSNAFSFSVPPSMQEEDVQPIDSAVGILRNETCELYYDYGTMAGDLGEYKDMVGSQTEHSQIAGREVTIVEVEDATRSQDPSYVIAAHFPTLQSGKRLTMRLRCRKEAVGLGRKIFRSLRFRSNTDEAPDSTR